MTQSPAGVIIIGAGQAGYSAADKLRRLGYDKPITMIGDEDLPPYQRPPLSKAYLLGEMANDRLLLRPASYYVEQGIELRLGTVVTSIDPEHKTVKLGEDTLPYDALILATGSRPKRLPEAIGGSLDGCYTIRNIKDIDAISGEFVAGRRLTIIGGGYIGLEVAAVASKLGLEVTLIEAAPRILQRVASAETADYFRSLHERHGVRILEQCQLEKLTGRTRVEAVQLASGDTIPSDFVVFGIGIVPNTELAQAAGIEVNNGIVTDHHGRCSLPDIYAAGDCTTLPYRDTQIRLESVGNAIEQAEAVAGHIAGEQTQYQPKPWFWSDQYETKLQIAGLNTGFDHTVTRHNSETSLSIWYYKGSELLAADSINDPRAYMIAKRLIESGKSPDPIVIADPSTNLKALLKA